MNDLIIGQVLWLVFRFNNTGDVSETKHPYLVAYIGEDVVEVIQLTSLKEGNMSLALSKRNKVIECEFPVESVINKDSVAQLDNKFTIDNYCGLSQFRQTVVTLTEDRLRDVLSDYAKYHRNNVIDENRIVHLTKDEIELLNPT